MTDSEKPDTPSLAPEAPAQATEVSAPAPSEPAPPKPADAPPSRGGKDKGPKKSMGMPRRRTLDPLPPAAEMERYTSGPKIRDLDDEIASELEAAMSGFSGQELLTVEPRPKQGEEGP